MRLRTRHQKFVTSKILVAVADVGGEILRLIKSLQISLNWQLLFVHPKGKVVFFVASHGSLS